MMIDIGPATMERVRPDLVVVRFKPGSVAGANSFMVSMNARREHFSDTPHGVMVVAPDDVDFQVDLLGKNHYSGQDADHFTRAVAIVSSNYAFTSLIELYYALHPVGFPVKVFHGEPEALAWVDQQLVALKGN